MKLLVIPTGDELPSTLATLDDDALPVFTRQPDALVRQSLLDDSNAPQLVSCYDAVILDESSLVDFYPCNEISGAVSYDVKSGNNGTITTANVSVDSTELLTDGEASYIRTQVGNGYGVRNSTVWATGSGGASSYEIWGIWSNANVASNHYILVTGLPSSNGLALSVNANQLWYWWTNSGSRTNTGVTIANNTLYHLVVTYNGGGAGSGVLTIYLNGVSVYSISTLSAWITPTGGWAFASDASSNAPGPTGNYAKVAVYNAVLSLSQVQAHYAAAGCGFPGEEDYNLANLLPSVRPFPLQIPPYTDEVPAAATIVDEDVSAPIQIARQLPPPQPVLDTDTTTPTSLDVDALPPVQVWISSPVLQPSADEEAPHGFVLDDSGEAPRYCPAWPVNVVYKVEGQDDITTQGIATVFDEDNAWQFQRIPCFENFIRVFLADEGIVVLAVSPFTILYADTVLDPLLSDSIDDPLMADPVRGTLKADGVSEHG